MVAATSIPIVILVFLGFIGTVFLAFIATVSGVVIRKASYLASPANSEPNFWNKYWGAAINVDGQHIWSKVTNGYDTFPPFACRCMPVGKALVAEAAKQVQIDDSDHFVLCCVGSVRMRTKR